jgi:hypothetical protein
MGRMLKWANTYQRKRPNEISNKAVYSLVLKANNQLSMTEEKKKKDDGLI